MMKKIGTMLSDVPRAKITFLLTVVLAATGCSIKKIAVNKLGDSLASGGTTFTSDDDPELVGDALPFSLKLMESLLAESPRHSGLLFAASSGFTQYAFVYVQVPAEEIESQGEIPGEIESESQTESQSCEKSVESRRRPGDPA